MLRRIGSFVPMLLVLATIGVGARVWFVAAEARPLPNPGDAVAYHLLGEGLAEGDGYVRPFDRIAGRLIPTAEWGPVYPVLLAAADVAGLDSTRQQRYLGAVLGSLAIVLTGLAGRALAGGRAGLGAAFVVALHPLLILHDTSLLTEGLAVVGGAVVLLAGKAAAGDGSLRAAAALGVAIGTAALLRADALALLVVLVVPLLLALARFPNRRSRFQALGVALGAAALVVVPWTARNAVRLDAFVPVSTNASTAVAGANCPETYPGGDVVGYWRFGEGCFTGYETAQLVADGEAAAAADAMDDGVAFAQAHASDLPQVVAARVRRLWGIWDVDQQVFLTALDERKPESWVRAGTYAGWVVTALAVVGAIRLARRRAAVDLLLLLAPLVAVTAVAAVTYGNARFRAGAEPALAVLAAAAVSLPRRPPVLA